MEHFSSISGSGVTAVYQGTIYFAGNLKLLDSMRIKHDDVLMKKATLWTEQANTVIYLSDPFRVLAAVAIADKVKLTSASAVQLLEQKGLDVYMLTGDNEHTAYAIARETQITKYKAEATPTEKAAFIKKLQDEGHVVGMVGDGINDSLALAQADISIAMGSGSDIAMDVAKMTLISSDLKQITKAINMAEKTVKTINQNLFWAFFYNVLAIPLAAGALYPVNGFMLNPMLAGAAMTLSSLSVVLNSLRLKMQDLS
jgi:Cu2+-exporting ATPase